MLFLSNLILAFCLVVFQTTLVHTLPLDIRLFDLILILIIYLGFYRDAFESMIIVVVSGILMDALSGGGFGTYCSVYIWLFLLVKAIVRYIHVKSFLLIPVVTVMAIIVENIFIAYTVAVKSSDLFFFPQFFNIVLFQAFWGIIVGTVLYYIILNMNVTLGKMLKYLFSTANNE